MEEDLKTIQQSLNQIKKNLNEMTILICHLDKCNENSKYRILYHVDHHKYPGHRISSQCHAHPYGQLVDLGVNPLGFPRGNAIKRRLLKYVAIKQHLKINLINLIKPVETKVFCQSGDSLPPCLACWEICEI